MLVAPHSLQLWVAPDTSESFSWPSLLCACIYKQNSEADNIGSKVIRMIKILAKTAAVHGLAGPGAPTMPRSWLSPSCSQTQLSANSIITFSLGDWIFNDINWIACYIAEFQRGKGVRRLKAKTTKTSGSPEELAPLKIRTSATRVPSLLLGTCKGRKEKLWLLLHSRTTPWRLLGPSLTVPFSPTFVWICQALC